MAGGANKKFIADPVKFMQENVVIVKSGAHESNDVKMFDLVESGKRETQVDLAGGISKKYARHNKWSTEGNKKIYDLVEYSGAARKNSHPISAYWCAYKDNDVKCVQLGPNAKIMFTPTINGCSIGVGDGQHPMVAHANMQEKVDGVLKTNQILMNGQLNGKIDDCRIFGKEMYTQENQVNVTFFGVFQFNEWHFYWQSRDGKIIKQDNKRTISGFSAATAW